MLSLNSKRFLFSVSWIFCLLFPAGRLSAQDYKFNHLSVENGMSQAVVNCILEDNKGFMWFGTQEGLNCYDGYSFHIFKHDPEDSNSLSNNFIYSLYQDRTGMIWIGTNGGGLNSYDPITGKFINFLNDPKDKSSISNDVVRAIHEDKTGKLWIGTDGGLNQLDRVSKKFSHLTNNPNDVYSISSDIIYDIIEDESGNIWCGTYGKGLSMYDPGKRRFYNYELTGEELEKLYPSSVTTDLKRRSQCSQVRSLLMFDPDHIWVGTDGGGLEVFNINSHVFESVLYPDENNYATIASSAVLSMSDDKHGNIWMAMFGGGVDVYSRKTKSLQHYTPNENDPYGLNSPSTRSVYADRTGNVWIGTIGEGLNIYFTSTSNISHIRRSERPGVGENTLASSKILSVMEDKTGLLWIGTSGGGLSTLDRKTGKYTQQDELSTSTNRSVLCLLQSRDGSIWAGTWGEGLNRKMPDGKISYYTPDNQLKNGAILCIAEEPATGAIWFGTFGAGLYRLDPVTDSLREFTRESDSLSSNYIYSIYFDKKGALWVGTRAGGLMRHNTSEKKFTSFQHDDKNKKSLSNNIVYCITEDHRGNLWLSTANGLDRYDASTGNFEIYYERDGLPSDNIYAILVDNNGELWLSHNKGLTRFNPLVKNDLFKNYGQGAGVQPSEFNQGAFFKNKKGELFFGGQSGLNIIDPQNIDLYYPPPAAYITSYKRFGKEIHLDTSIIYIKHLNVSWRDNNFMFQVAALNFVDPAKNLYQYKLDGIDDDWSPVTNNRYISYTNLPGGTYSLHVRASDCNGNWSEDKVLLVINVEPPFWRTNWFYSLCVVLLVAGIFTFIRVRTAVLKKENRILEAKVAERTQELAQKNADITSSIQYAKRIQTAMLPDLEVITEHFPQSFVLYKPKDIVSGDFYWFEERSGKNILAVGDCTGHGVPGALMSMIGHNVLNQVVLEKGITDPDKILNSLNEGVRSALKQDQHEQDTTDGMDIGIISYDKVKQEILFAGALRPLIVIRNGLLSKVDSDRFPIGGSQDTRDMKFSIHRFPVNTGDTLYMFSDGYADQFGGAKGKKFMMKNLLGKLQAIQHLSMQEQAAELDKAFEDWRTGFQQVDDVLVVGIRIS